jgi:hypothetical protein
MEVGMKKKKTRSENLVFIFVVVAIVGTLGVVSALI